MITKMPDSQYFALDAISNSYISSFLKCPAATLTTFDTTPAMALGSAIHCFVLEGADEFAKRYAVMMDKIDRRTSVGKLQYEEFCRINAGKIILSAADFEIVTGTLQSVFAHPSASEMFRSGQCEQAITWEDTTTGLPCKAKADWLTDGILVDLKTTSSDAANPAKWFRKMMDMGYHRQMAFYGDGLKANDVQVDKHLLVVVDTVFPYAIGVYSIHKDIIDAGRKVYKEALKGISCAKESHEYPRWNNPNIVELKFPEASTKFAIERNAA